MVARILVFEPFATLVEQHGAEPQGLSRAQSHQRGCIVLHVSRETCPLLRGCLPYGEIQPATKIRGRHPRSGRI